MATELVPISAIVAGLPSASIVGLLVFCRVSAAIMLLPGLGEADPPPSLRIGLAFGVTVLLLPPLLGEGSPVMASFPTLAIAVIREVSCGLFLGMTARLVALSLPIAAEFLALATGLTSVVQPDPAFGAQSSALTRLFSLAAPVILLSSGLFRLPLEAVADSYSIVSLGGALPAGDAATVIVRAASESFSCGLRLASPLLIAGTLWQVSLALLTRFVPSLQAGAALAPGQLLGGTILLGVLSGPLLAGWLRMADDMFSSLLPFHG